MYSVLRDCKDFYWLMIHQFLQGVGRLYDTIDRRHWLRRAEGRLLSSCIIIRYPMLFRSIPKVKRLNIRTADPNHTLVTDVQF